MSKLSVCLFFLLVCVSCPSLQYKTYDFPEKQNTVFWAGVPYSFEEPPKDFLYVLGKWKDEQCWDKGITSFHEEMGNYIGVRCPKGHTFGRGVRLLLSMWSKQLYCYENTYEKFNCRCLFYIYYPEGEEHFKNKFRKPSFCTKEIGEGPEG